MSGCRIEVHHVREEQTGVVWTATGFMKIKGELFWLTPLYFITYKHCMDFIVYSRSCKLFLVQQHMQSTSFISLSVIMSYSFPPVYLPIKKLNPPKAHGMMSIVHCRFSHQDGYCTNNSSHCSSKTRAPGFRH